MLNEFGFPLRLSAKALSDRNYYNRRAIQPGIGAMC
jgi:hypothetical protein